MKIKLISYQTLVLVLITFVFSFLSLSCNENEEIVAKVQSNKPIGYRDGDTCDCKIQVRCAVNRCPTLMNDRVNEWFVFLNYYTSSQVPKFFQLDSYSNSIGTWYNIPFPVLQSAFLSGGRYHELIAEASHCHLWGGSYSDNQNTAIGVYVVIDCNDSNDTWDVHRLFPNSDLNCTYAEGCDGTPDSKAVTVSSTCITSSSNSVTLDDDEEFYPCDPAAGGPGIGG